MDADRACAFLEDYEGAGGSVPRDPDESLVPLIRWRLREEIRRARGAAAHGVRQTDGDREYVARQVRAFAALRGLEVPFV